jgi:hypothetical protein
MPVRSRVIHPEKGRMLLYRQVTLSLADFSMSALTVSEVQRILTEISNLKEQRSKRDQWTYSQVLLDSATALQKHFDIWLREEIKVVTKEIELVRSVVSPRAVKELTELRLEIGAVKDLRVQEARKKLSEFVSRLQKGEYQTTSDVIEDFVKLAEPSISMIQDMTKIRGKVDSVIVRELLPLAGSESLTTEEDEDLEEALDEVRKGKAHVFNNAEEAVRFLKS